MRTLSIAEARNRLPAIVHEVESGPAVRLVRHGQPVAVIVSALEYERLAQGQGGFWEAVQAFRAARTGGAEWLEEPDLADLRDQTTGREVSV
mgnify:CR=1 FL=1